MGNIEAYQILCRKTVFGRENVSPDRLAVVANVDEMVDAIVEVAKAAWMNGRAQSLKDCGVLGPFESWPEPAIDSDPELLKQVCIALESAPLLKRLHINELQG